MDLIDRKIAELRKIRAQPTRRKDFDSFWQETMRKVENVPLDIEGGEIDYPIKSLRAHDITFKGLDGTPIKTWLLLPHQPQEARLPVVVSYHGAGGSREYPSCHTQWLSMGAAVIAMDVRLQGGTTGSLSGFDSGNTSGYTSIGLLERERYYTYHVWTDALRAVRIAYETPGLDTSRICVNGGSQGGALSLAVAALRKDIALCMADVPSNCWMEKRVMDRTGGASAIANYLRRHPDHVDQVCSVLSYFDNVNLAERIRCPVLVSVGLKDNVCPPENVFAAYNRIRASKRIDVYPFGEHDGGGSFHNEHKVAFLAKHLLGRRRTARG